MVIRCTTNKQQTPLVANFDDDLSLQIFFALNGKSNLKQKKQIAGIVRLQQFLMIIRPNRFPGAFRVTNRATVLDPIP